MNLFPKPLTEHRKPQSKRSDDPVSPVYVPFYLVKATVVACKQIKCGVDFSLDSSQALPDLGLSSLI